MFLNKTKNCFSKNLKIPWFEIFSIFSMFEIFQKTIFCFVQEHIEKTKIFKIKIYFSKLLILNRYVSNLQVPTTSESPWGKVNVSKFMDFGEIRLVGKKTHIRAISCKNPPLFRSFLRFLRTGPDGAAGENFSISALFCIDFALGNSISAPWNPKIFACGA